MECTYCKGLVSPNATKCPHCGEPDPTYSPSTYTKGEWEQEQKSSDRAGIFLLSLVGGVVGGFIGMFFTAIWFNKFILGMLIGGAIGVFLGIQFWRWITKR
jgi:hypothetical protein